VGDAERWKKESGDHDGGNFYGLVVFGRGRRKRQAMTVMLFPLRFLPACVVIVGARRKRRKRRAT